MEFFTYIGIFWCVLQLMKFFSARAEFKQKIENIREEADRKIRIVQLEPLPGQKTILAYDAENNHFLAQGKNEEEIKQRIMKRFPEKIFLLRDEPFTALPNTIIKQ
jgi:hypothetical protein